MPARERKAVAATRESRHVTDTKTQRAPKPKGLPQIQDFQFYPKRLHELIEREIYAHRKAVNYKVRGTYTGVEAVWPLQSKYALFQALAPSELSGKEAERAREEEQRKIDGAEPLTREEQEEKEQLLEEGMGDWSKKVRQPRMGFVADHS